MPSGLGPMAYPESRHFSKKDRFRKSKEVERTRLTTMTRLAEAKTCILSDILVEFSITYLNSCVIYLHD